ncbi:hypothetical protein Tco_1294008 [Tanacetum coccineum]
MWNEVLLTKHLRNVATKKDTLWVKWIIVEKLQGKSIWEVQSDCNRSVGWKNILSLRDKNREHIWWKIGNGRSVNVWHDKWCSVSPLSDFIEARDIYDARLSNNCIVSEVIQEGRWLWLEEWSNDFEELMQVQIPNINDGNEDTAVWEIWNELLNKLNVRLSGCWDQIIDEMKALPAKKNISSIVRRLVCGAAVYYIWQERNNRLC